MTNREKFAEQILDIACSRDRLAVYEKTGEPAYCSKIKCAECMFLKSCREETTMEWAKSEYIEKPKISESDRRFLDYIPDKYKYMARDERGALFAYINKPRKDNVCCSWFSDAHEMVIPSDYKVAFPMVEWDDEEPWAIEDLKKLEVEE